MKRAIILATSLTWLGLSGCNNDPDDASDETSGAAQSVPLGDPSESETETSGAETRLNAVAPDTGSPASDDRSDTMIRGGSDTAGTTPPKGSKLQRVD